VEDFHAEMKKIRRGKCGVVVVFKPLGTRSSAVAVIADRAA